MRNRNIPLLSQEKIETEDECWPWLAARSSAKGKPVYGAFCPNLTQTFPAHRVAYFLATGDDPIGFVVMHKCDNPPCCNPNHLKKGTIAENNEDAKLKGRTALGDRNAARLYPEKWHRGDEHWTRRMPERLARGNRSGAYTHPEKINRGSSSGQAKLTESDVIAIRHARSQGESLSSMAARFGVRKGTISFIVQRKTWTHI